MKHAVLALLALALSACVSAPPTSTAPQASIEDRKKEIAILRDKGAIGFEEAARRQYAIQRGAYALSPGEVAFWEESIGHARAVDQRRLSPAGYKARVQAAYARHMGRG